MIQQGYDKKCAELEWSKQETKTQREQAEKVPPLEREVREMEGDEREWFHSGKLIRDGHTSATVAV